MQSFAPVTLAELLAPVQRMRYRVEIYDGAVGEIRIVYYYN